MIAITQNDNPFNILHALASDKVVGQLSHRDLRVLAYFCKQQSPVQMIRVATALDLPPGSLTRSCDRLTDAGLLRRFTDEANRRSVIGEPTETGRAATARVAALIASPQGAATTPAIA